jgi:hypothetical protein
MLRDNLVGLIEPMLNSAGAYSLALCTEWKPSSDDRPRCLENPRPEGAESTLTENACSPFHAEPRQFSLLVTGFNLPQPWPLVALGRYQHPLSRQRIQPPVRNMFQI